MKDGLILTTRGNQETGGESCQAFCCLFRRFHVTYMHIRECPQVLVGDDGIDDRESVASIARPQQPSQVAASSDIIGGSWVPSFTIAQEAFDRRSPNGHRCVPYKKALLETYAIYGPKARWDGRLWRLTKFHDLIRTDPSECVEVSITDGFWWLKHRCECQQSAHSNTRLAHRLFQVYRAL